MKSKVNGVMLARLAVSLVLLVAATGKLLDPAGFGAAIERYRLVPPLVAGGLALYLPWLELALALAWWSSRWRRSAGVLICALLAVFVFAVASSWMRGLDIRCGCFGKALDSSLPLALARNVVLLLAAGWVWRTDQNRKRVGEFE